MTRFLKKPTAAFLTVCVALTCFSTRVTAQITEVPNPDETVGIIRMADMGSNEVLDMLERFMNRPILRQQNLPAVKINFTSRGPMTKSDAVLAIESLLSMNGIAVTDLGDKFLKAVPSAAVSTQVPPIIDGEADTAAPSQRIYAKFYQLDYLTVEEALPLIQPVLTQGTPLSFTKSNSILVVDALINLQRLDRILDRIDEPSEVALEILFFQLKHVTASELATRLTTLQGGSLKRYLENNTTVDADDRTNQLLIFTHESNKPLLEDLIGKLDVDVAPLTKTEVFRLKHADATEITNIIEQVVTGQQRAREQQSSGAASGAAQRQQQQQQQANQQARQRAAEQLGTENLQFSDFMRIVADPRANAIVAYGTPNDIIYLQELVTQLDVLLAQVRIEVVIAEVTLSDDVVRGISVFNLDYNRGGDGAGGNEIEFGITFPSTDRVAPGQFLSGTIKEASISYVMNAARQNSNVKVLSAPTVVTTHNQEATIIVGEQRPVITSSQSGLESTLSRSTVQFRDIGIELTVKPLIGANGVVQLEIDQQVETVVDQVMIDQNEQPVIGRRQATSFVSVKDGELVVLGGLQQLEDTLGRTRMNLLGDIPLIGGLFGGKSVSSVKRELLMFIQPHVIENTQEAFVDAEERIEALSNAEQVDDYIETGTFEPTRKKKKYKGLQW